MTIIARPIPEDFTQHATMPRGELAARYGVSASLITLWRRRAGIVSGKGPTPSTPPEGFAEIASLFSAIELKLKYGVCGETIRKWRKICGAGPKTSARYARPVPDDFAEHAARNGALELCARYACHFNTIKRWRAETGIHYRPPAPKMRYQKSPKRGFTQPVTGRMVLPGHTGYLPPPLAGREQDAAQFLRRHFPIVCRCDAEGHADQTGKFWRCGALVLEPAKMIEKAGARGWEPDAWQKVA